MQNATVKPSNCLCSCRIEKLVGENLFRYAGIERTEVPTFAAVRHLLPDPDWPGHDDALKCYWRVWELAFANIKQASPDNGFISHCIDSAFNGNLFLWDSVLIQFFARYGTRAFDFQRTLNNLYHRQHNDGYICRELLPVPGGEMFYPHDPVSTGPNLLAWCEWEHFLHSGDRERLRHVFPVILAYHRWTRLNRTWQNGSYWACALSSGMDSQKRIDASSEDAIRVCHGHLSWIDATAQALLSARCLVEMAGTLGRLDEVSEEQQEISTLCAWINNVAWDEASSFYFDVDRDGCPTNYKSIAAYWVLLADAAPPERSQRLVAWLDDPDTFNRPHRVPCIAKNVAGYQPNGGYWLGGVWPPTNYMVLHGLTAARYDDMAYDIACNHHDRVVEVFKNTGTVWEFYAPESIAPGESQYGPAVKDFVGWGGLGPIAVLLEYRFGLRPKASRRWLVWDIRETSAFGVERYPFGRDGLIHLSCAARSDPRDKPSIQVRSNCDFTLELRWPGGSETRLIQGSEA